jgi:hypothetical protein
LSPHLHFLNIANIKQSKKRKTSYAQKIPRRKSPALGLNPYAPIGQSQETPQQIAAKRERAAIQRGHRTIARAGGSPSPTPNMSQLMAGHICWTTPNAFYLLRLRYLLSPTTRDSTIRSSRRLCVLPTAHHKHRLQWS